MPFKKIRLRLYADENFPVPSSTFLKSKGISVVHAYDFGYTNKSDNFHINEVCHKALPKITPNFAKGSFIKITTGKIHRTKDGDKQELDLA